MVAFLLNVSVVVELFALNHSHHQYLLHNASVDKKIKFSSETVSLIIDSIHVGEHQNVKKKISLCDYNTSKNPLSAFVDTCSPFHNATLKSILSMVLRLILKTIILPKPFGHGEQLNDNMPCHRIRA